MKKVILKLLLGIVALFIVGCTAGCESTVLEDERANLVATQKTFASVVRSLTKARDAGKIEDKEVQERIGQVIKVVDENLKIWEQALLDGESKPEIRDIVITNVQILKDILLEAESK